VFLVAAPVTAASIVVTPEAIETGQFSLGGPCPHRARTGVGCYSCGMTRGLAAAGSARFVTAWHYHPAAPLLFVLACAAACGSLATLAFAARHYPRAPAA
jgi:hypothetical protein